MTPTGLPSTPKLEVEFTAGVWTDVTSDLDVRLNPLQVRFGRTSPYSQPQVATLTATLYNPLGKYSPKRQVLFDGVTAHPYYPNVQPRKRIRWSYVAGTQKIRFLGYITAWTPQLLGGDYQMVVIQASDRMDQLSRVDMQSPLATEYMADTPTVFWPLTDGTVDTGTQYALDASGNARPALTVRGLTQEALNFGDNGPGYGDGSGVKFTPGSNTSGQYLVGQKITGLSLSAFTIEIWINAGTQQPAWVTGSTVQPVLRLLRLSDLGFNGLIGIASSGRPFFKTLSTINGPRSIVDGGWHHIAVTRATSGGSSTLWVDGVNIGGTVGSPSVTDMDYLTLGVGAFAVGRFAGNLGYVAIYDHVLSAGRIQAHHDAGTGYYGDTTDERMQRFLGLAGLSGTDWSLDAGQTLVNTYPQAGKDVVSACQDMAATEGGGAAFYVTPDGQVRFANRRYRDNRTPILTLDAGTDLLDSGWAPIYDDSIVNSVTAARSAESGTLANQTWDDTDSESQFGLSTDSVTTYTTTDSDALNLAQSRVAANAQPSYRVPQITVDLVAANHDLYAAVANVQIGSRLRLANLTSDASPVSQFDVFAEGWTETYGVNTYLIAFDATAVDYRWKWDTSRWGPDPGGAVLNAAITRTATTLAIKTLSGPTWTTNPAMYPMVIQVGEEQIQLNSVPGGSSSPQTYTGVTRGMNGTPAAAQSINAVITLAPADAWAL